MRLNLLTATAVMMLTTAPVLAQGTATPAASATASGAAAVPIDAFEQAMAARQVADFARRQKDPVAMLTAARMLQEIPVEGSSPLVGPMEGAFSPASLFAEAKTLAKGDQALLMQITVAQSTGSRGVMSSAFGKGLVRSVQEVAPRGTYRFTINAKGGEPLRMGAIGDVGTNLFIRMKDSAGKTVCLDDNTDYAPVCAVTPRAGGAYAVEVGNKSAAKSRAVILSN